MLDVAKSYRMMRRVDGNIVMIAVEKKRNGSGTNVTQPFSALVIVTA